MRVGPVPRFGVVRNDGRLIVWQDGEPTVLTRFVYKGETGDDEIVDLDYLVPERLVWTPFGMLMHDHGWWGFLGSDGETTSLADDTGPMAVTDGGRLAVAAGNGPDGIVLRLHDLRTGTAEELTLPVESAKEPKLAGVFDGWVFVNAYPPDGDATWRWRPGRAPDFVAACHSRQIDGFSGTRLSRREGAWEVITAEGETHCVKAGRAARLMPGGDALYELDQGTLGRDGNPGEPSGLRCEAEARTPGIRMFDFQNRMRQVFLPPDSRLTGLVWEDRRHVLVPAEPTEEEEWPVRAYRLDVGSGGVELVGGLGIGPQSSRFIQRWDISTWCRDTLR